MSARPPVPISCWAAGRAKRPELRSPAGAGQPPRGVCARARLVAGPRQDGASDLAL
jgi:hypothetical protein